LSLIPYTTDLRKWRQNRGKSVTDVIDNTDEQHKKKILECTINSMTVKIKVINNKLKI